MEKREWIRGEIDFGLWGTPLEHPVKLLNTDTSLSEALSKIGDLGQLGKVCERISSGLQNNQLIDRTILGTLRILCLPQNSSRSSRA